MFIKGLNRVHLRRFFAVVGVFLLSVTLTACGGGSRMINGRIGDWGTYASLGDLDLSHQELWNELRFSSIDVLNHIIDEVILEPQLDRISFIMDDNNVSRFIEQDENDREQFEKLLDEFALEGIFNTDEDGFARLTVQERTNLVRIFLADRSINDHVYIAKIDANPNSAIHYGSVLPNPDSRSIEHLNFAPVRRFFHMDLARRLFARDQLERQVFEHNQDYERGREDNPFHTETAILSYFREHYENTGDVTAIVIPFVNQQEAINTLRSFGIMIHEGAWWWIPSETGESWSDYIARFDELTINVADPTDEAIALNNVVHMHGILRIFIEIYHFIYGFRPTLAVEGGPAITSNDRTGIDRRNITAEIVRYYDNIEPDYYDADEIFTTTSEFLNFTREDIDAFGSVAFRNFIYNDLTAFNDLNVGDIGDVQNPQPFNANPQTFGTNTHFLVYKINVEEDLFITQHPSEYDIIIYNDYDEEIINPLHPLHAIIINQLNEDRLTTAFINSTMSDAREDISIRIFDSILEIAFSLQNPNHSRTLGGPPNNFTMARINFTDRVVIDGAVENRRRETKYLDVHDVFNRLELTIGTSTAVDLLTRKFMTTTEHFTSLDSDDEAEFLGTLNVTLARFANNEFATQGFPASMGKHNFMLMQFRTANVNDIIRYFFKVNATMTHYINNFLNDDNLIEFLKEFTDVASDNFLSFSAVSLFIYLDDNDDGLPDILFDYEGNENWSFNPDYGSSYNDRPSTGPNSFVQLASDLEAYIREALRYSHNQVATLRNIVDEFNSTARHASENNSPLEPETQWARFRFMGIRLQLAEFSGITNVSDSTQIPEPLLNRAAYLFENDPRLVTGDHVSVPLVDRQMQHTEDGLHLFVITEGQLAPDFTFNEDSDLFELLQQIPIVINGERLVIDNLKDDEGRISENQILLFIFQQLQLSGTGINLIPSDILAAMNQFFAPVFNRFNSETTQRELLILFVSNHYLGENVNLRGFTFYTATDNYVSPIREYRFERIRQTAKDLEDNFIEGYGMNNNFFNWWNRLIEVFGNGGEA